MKRVLIFNSIILLLFFSCKNAIEPMTAEIKMKLANELEDMVYWDQYYRSELSYLEKSDSRYSKKKDSLWQLQNNVDAKNIKRLVEITEQYGFPSVERLEAAVPAWVILQHTNNEYNERVKKLLEIERTHKRIPQNEYAMIKWHLNGRKGIPEGMDGVEINDLRN